MTADNKSKSNPSGNSAIKGKKRKQRYLPHNKPVKRKGSYPLRPGVQGFFITCDGGRERQASDEAVNVIDSFYEELVHGKDSGVKLAELPNKPLNKKIKFSYSESSSSDDDEEEDEDQNTAGTSQDDIATHKDVINQELDPHTKDGMHHENQTEEKTNGIEGDGKNHENQPKETEKPPAKKQCLETYASKHVIHEKVEQKSIDRLIEAELEELGDKNKNCITFQPHFQMDQFAGSAKSTVIAMGGFKLSGMYRFYVHHPLQRRFVKLDSGCNGVIFIQMRKRDGDPGPKTIVQHMMTSVASTRKHMSRFILRMLPIEVACYTSEEEISRAIKPLVAQYFPAETQTPQKFAVLFEARANSSIDRMKIINAVAKSVPGPHKVDLNNPDKTIVVEIIKTVCLIGVVEQYKELAKYNLRQLTSPKP